MADTPVHGMDELTDRIALLNDALCDALPAIVLDAARRVEAEIASRAPVYSGALVHSLSVGDIAGGQANSQGKAGAIVQVDTSNQGGQEHYAIFDEFGTSRQPARPFFRPGVAAAVELVRELLTSRVNDIIGKSA